MPGSLKGSPPTRRPPARHAALNGDEMALGFMRRHKKWLYVFLWLVIAAFIVLYVPALDPTGEGTPSETVVSVGGEPISVGELAARSGVSQRVLELRFQEIARMTPLRFMRWNRMNHVRRKLLAADGRSASVTHIASSCGIGELGRFAVEYKQLFGESPSATLSRKPVLPPRRFLDLLPDAPDR